MIVDTNVRVSKDAHVRWKTLADLWGISMSEVINRLIDREAPEVDEIIRQRAEQKKQFSKKLGEPGEN